MPTRENSDRRHNDRILRFVIGRGWIRCSLPSKIFEHTDQSRLETFSGQMQSIEACLEGVFKYHGHVRADRC